MKSLIIAVFIAFSGRTAISDSFKAARTIYLSENNMEAVRVAVGRTTVINFPSKPTEVVPGSQGLFAVRFIQNDLAIGTLTDYGHSNLFVYIGGKRLAFDLQAVRSAGDEVVVVRDSEESKIKVKVRHD